MIVHDAMKDSQVIVVGAGIAGLTAAYQLQKNGTDVIVLEASSKVGGRMTTDSIDGYIIDGGAQFLSSAYPIISELITELEIASEYVETSQWVGVVKKGEALYGFQTVSVAVDRGGIP